MNKKFLSKSITYFATGALVVSAWFVSYKPMTPVKMSASPGIGNPFPIVMNWGGSGLFAAEDKVDCDAKFKDAKQKEGGASSDYQHGALRYFNGLVRMLNNVFPSAPETALCHFVNGMGLNPDKSALPTSITKTHGGKTVVLDVVVPTESWATTLGYDAKATVKVNDTTFMVLYWGGSKTESKGFMIQGPNGLGKADAGDGKGSKNHMMYIQWDRASDTQFVKVMGGMYTTSYLGSYADNDHAIYGEGSYNKANDSATVQIVMIQPGRVSTNEFGCYKAYGSGVKGGTISMAKTEDALNNAGHVETSTTKDRTGMDGVSLPDKTSTPNVCQSISGSGCSTLNNTELDSLISFKKSCNDIWTAGSSGQPFANDTVDFTKAPTDIFPTN